MRPLRPLLCTVAVAATALLAPGALAGPATVDPRLLVTEAVHYDTGAPLREVVGLTLPASGKIVREAGRHPALAQQGLVDPVVQASAPLAARARLVANYTGLGADYGHGFSVNSLPPDTVGAAGRTQYVQWVNSSFLVLDKKTGLQLLDPLPGNAFWKGFGGACEKSNDGDPVVNYDRQARRWVMQQFVATAPYLECLAISTSDDATGAYHRYAFSYGTSFNDYPKAGVWSHSYVSTYNMFGDTSSDPSGPRVCALERARMLAGRSARQACIQLGAGDPLLLPADIDGTRFPGAGEDVPMLGLGTNALTTYAFHVDWATPSRTRLSSPTSVPVAAYNPACGMLYRVGARLTAPCAPQPGTGAVGQFAAVGLDVLSDRPMFRLAWRRFADGHDAMVITHAVDAQPKASAAVRWYQLRRKASSPWTVQQQGTYAPDGDSRWMSSAAMDKLGGIAIGYSVSGPTLTFPSIRIAARTVGDPAGQLSAETSVATGSGEQLTASYIARWGDYSAMTVDPVDDCTLWYTTEYMSTTGVFDWSTRVAAVRLPGC